MKYIPLAQEDETSVRIMPDDSIQCSQEEMDRAGIHPVIGEGNCFQNLYGGQK